MAGLQGVARSHVFSPGASCSSRRTPLPSEEALLAEYGAAQHEVDRLNKQLWTTAQILVPISFAGIGLLSTLSVHSPETLTAIAISAVGSSLILRGWLDLARRWLAYQDITLDRMREIETELDLWRVRSELYAADRSRGTDRLGPSRQPSEGEKLRLGGIPDPRIPRGRPTGKIIRDVVWLIVASWVVVVVRELALVLGWL